MVYRVELDGDFIEVKKVLLLLFVCYRYLSILLLSLSVAGGWRELLRLLFADPREGHHNHNQSRD